VQIFQLTTRGHDVFAARLRHGEASRPDYTISEKRADNGCRRPFLTVRRAHSLNGIRLILSGNATESALRGGTRVGVLDAFHPVEHHIIQRDPFRIALTLGIGPQRFYSALRCSRRLLIGTSLCAPHPCRVWNEHGQLDRPDFFGCAGDLCTTTEVDKRNPAA